MTLSQIIKLRTNNGRDVIDFLVEVMHDRYKDFQMCHRLQAARLLKTYGNEDAPGFIDDNTADSSSRTRKRTRKRRRKPRRPNRFDTELARVIREDTDDGRSTARFLVDVMEGELRSFKPHHRMSAARELLDRGFGKSARKEKVSPPVHPEPVEGPEPTEEHSPVVPADAGTQRSQGRETLTPHSSPLTPRNPEPVEGPKPVSTVRPEPVEGHTRNPDRHSRESGNPGAGEALTPHSSPLTPNQTDILDTLIHLQPDHFEQTVLDLLEAIGYGRGHHLGRTGDGGIDGIIDLDHLGIDKLYVQAKRWTNPVGEPEIRNFSGSLDPHGATRGLFITTSDFTDTARRTARTISAGYKHIRLVDGEELAQLMISQNMGVETVTAHRARKLEEDHPTQHT